MRLSSSQREITGRATMAIVAVAIAWGATILLRLAIQSIRNPDAVPYLEALDCVAVLAVGFFFIVDLLLYVVAIWLLCFVFTSGASKSQPARAMTWANRIASFFEFLFRSLFRVT